MSTQNIVINGAVILFTVIILFAASHGSGEGTNRISGNAVLGESDGLQSAGCSVFPKKFKVGCAVRIAKDGSNIAKCLPEESAVNGLCVGNGFSPVAGCPWNTFAKPQSSPNGLSVECAPLQSKSIGWYCAGSSQTAAICCG